MTGRVCSNCVNGSVGLSGTFCLALMLAVDDHEALECDIFDRIA